MLLLRAARLTPTSFLRYTSVNALRSHTLHDRPSRAGVARSTTGADMAASLFFPVLCSGFNVEVSRHLVGSKKAIRQGNTIFVSPAMFDLMKHATQQELQFLLSKIEMFTIPDPPNFLAVDLSLISVPHGEDFSELNRMLERLRELRPSAPVSCVPPTLLGGDPSSYNYAANRQDLRDDDDTLKTT